MELLERIKAPFRDDWCRNCGRTMEHTNRRLFAIPDMTVGHYESHTEVRYFKRALWPVEEREDIPAGTYACRALEYRCPRCGRRRVKLSVFLPVRDKNKMEEIILFDDGEQMEFLWH